MPITPFSEWTATRPADEDRLDQMRQYSRETKLNLLRSGEYDPETAAYVDEALMETAQEEGIDLGEDPVATFKARPVDDDSDLLYRYAFEKGDTALADAARTYSALKSDRVKSSFPSNDEYLTKLEEAKANLDGVIDAIPVNNALDDPRNAARKAAVDRGDKPFALLTEPDGSQRLYASNGIEALAADDETMARVFEANPDLDPDIIPMIREKARVPDGYTAPIYKMDRQQEFFGAAGSHLAQDPASASKMKQLVDALDSGGANARPYLEQLDMAMAESGLHQEFTDPEERMGFILDMVKHQSAPKIDEENVDNNLITLSTGEVRLPDAVLFNKPLFDRTLAESKSIPTAQKNKLLATRQAHMEAAAPSAFATIASRKGSEFLSFRDQRKAEGKTNGEILDEWMSNPANQPDMGDRYVGGAAMSVVDAVGTIFLGVPALMGNTAALDSLQNIQKDQASRKAYSQLFGRNLGVSYDLTTMLAPVAADMLTSLGIGAVARTAASTGIKAGLKAGARGMLREALSTETQSAVRSFLSRSAARQGTATTADEIITLAGRDMVERLTTVGRNVGMNATYFNRSAASTYAGLTADLEAKGKTPEEAREIALPHALVAGAITVGVTNAFNMLGAKGIERVLTGDLTRGQVKAIYGRLTREFENLPAAMREGIDMTSADTFLRSTIKKGLQSSLMRGVPAETASEALEEATDQALNTVNEQIARGEKIDIVAAVKEGAYAGLLGGALGGAVAGVRSAAIGSNVSEEQEMRLRRETLLATATKLDKAYAPETARALRRLAAQRPAAPTAPTGDAPPAVAPNAEEGVPQGDAVTGLQPSPVDAGVAETVAGFDPELLKQYKVERAGIDTMIGNLQAETGGTTGQVERRTRAIKRLRQRAAQLDKIIADADAGRTIQAGTTTGEFETPGQAGFRPGTSAAQPVSVEVLPKQGELPAPETPGIMAPAIDVTAETVMPEGLPAPRLGRLTNTPPPDAPVEERITATAPATANEVQVPEANSLPPVESQPAQGTVEGGAAPGIGEGAATEVEVVDQPDGTATVDGRKVIPWSNGRWLVQTEENRQRELSGQRQIGGDLIYDSREQAIEETRKEVIRERANAASRARDAEAAATAAQTEAVRLQPLSGYTSGMTPMQRGKAEKSLRAKWSTQSKSLGKEYRGERFEVINQMVADGYMPAAEDGKYRLEQADGTGFSITKTDFNYASWALENQTPTTSVEGAATEGALTRDPKKHRRHQTPDEFKAEFSYEQALLRSESDYTGKSTKALKKEGKAKYEARTTPLLEKQHRDEILASIGLDEEANRGMSETLGRDTVIRNSVSAEAVDTYGITLPEGYVREGELYVYRPTTEPEPPVLDDVFDTPAEVAVKQVQQLGPAYAVDHPQAIPMVAEQAGINPEGMDAVEAAQVAGVLRPTEGLRAEPATPSPRTTVVAELESYGFNPGNIQGFLRNVASRSKRKHEREIASLLLNHFPDMLARVPVTLSNLPAEDFAGMYLPKSGQIVINSRMVGPRGAVDTVLHELLHAATVESIANPTPAQAKILKRLDRVRQSVQRKALNDETLKHLRYGTGNLDEFVTHFWTDPDFRKAVGDLTPKGEKNWVRVIMDAIRDLLNGRVRTESEKVSAEVMSDMVSLLESASRRPWGPSKRDVYLGLPAHHGTPHKVDKFRLDRIGTGEGNQAYGWGLYFAGSKGVAEYYRRVLSKSNSRAVDPEVRRKYFTPGNIVQGYSGYDKVLGYNEADDGRWSVTVQRVRKNDSGDWVVDEYEPVRTHATEPDRKELKALGLVEQEGNLYTVDLKPDEDEYLDWDKPLSEQSEKVRKQIRKALKDTKGESLIKNDATGNEIYQHVSASAFLAEGVYDVEWDDAFKDRWSGKNGAFRITQDGDVVGWNLDLPKNSPPNKVLARFFSVAGSEMSQKGGSMVLLGNGIKGVRYLDGASRGKGEGDYNYVIFDENDIEILEENGIPVGARMQPGSPADVMRFTELTADLGESPTQEQINTWKETNSGAYAELKAMREEVLRAAGYKGPWFHGTNSKPFNTFEIDDSRARDSGFLGRAFYFTRSENMAESFGKNIVRAMIRWSNPFDVRIANDDDAIRLVNASREKKGLSPLNAEKEAAIRKDWSDLPARDADGPPPIWRERFFKDQGDTAAMANDAGHDAVMGASEQAIAVTNPNQIKSTEPLSLDAEGRLITPDRWADPESPDIRFQPGVAAATVTPEQDAAYLAAVEAGDMETAQRMVDEAARKAIRSLPKSSNENRVPNTNSISASLDSHESFGVLEVPVSWFNGLGKKAFATKHDVDKVERLIDDIRENGIESPLIVVVDGHPDGLAYVLEGAHRLAAIQELGLKDFPALVVYDESAEAVTYDADGNVIPLSQRFNQSSPDIRFQPGVSITPDDLTPVVSREDAERQFSEGKRLFAFDEMTGEATEVSSLEMLNNYPPDALGWMEPDALQQLPSTDSPTNAASSVRSQLLGFLPDNLTPEDLGIDIDTIAEQVDDVDPVNAEAIIRVHANHALAVRAAEDALGDTVDADEKARLRDLFTRITTGNTSDADIVFHRSNPDALQRLMRYLAAAFRSLVERFRTAGDTRTAVMIDRIGREYHAAKRGWAVTETLKPFDPEEPRMQQSGDDAAYLAAVEAGDMETAQRMVVDAAKAAGMPVTDSLRYYPGWWAKTEVRFDQMVPHENAERYDVDTLEEMASDIEKNGITTPVIGYLYGDAFDIVDGHHRFHILKDYLGVDKNYMVPAWIQLEAALFDDNGVLIPLSQRFNQSSPDSRYQPAAAVSPDIEQYDAPSYINAQEGNIAHRANASEQPLTGVLGVLKRMFVRQTDLSLAAENVRRSYRYVENGVKELSRHLAVEFGKAKEGTIKDGILINDELMDNFNRALGTNKPQITKEDTRRINDAVAERQAAAAAAEDAERKEAQRVARNAIAAAKRQIQADLAIAEELQGDEDNTVAKMKSNARKAAVSDYEKTYKRIISTRSKSYEDARKRRTAVENSIMDFQRDMTVRAMDANMKKFAAERDLSQQWLDANAPKMAAWARTFRRERLRLNKELKKIFPASESPDFHATLTRTADLYLVRSYAIHHNPALAQQILNDEKHQALRESTIDFFRRSFAEQEIEMMKRLSKYEGLTDEQLAKAQEDFSIGREVARLRRMKQADTISEEAMVEMAKVNVAERARIAFEDLIMGHDTSETLESASNGLRVPIDRLRQKKDIAPEIREALQEVTDPLFNSLRTLEAMARLVTSNRQTLELASIGKAEGWLVTQAEKEADRRKYDKWVPLVSANAENRAFPNLAGLYAPPEQKKAFDSAYGTGGRSPSNTSQGILGRLNDRLRNIAGLSMGVVTLGNLAYFTRGFAGSHIIALATGAAPGLSGGAYRKGYRASAFSSVLGPDTRWFDRFVENPEAFRDEMLELVSLGVLKDAHQVSYLNELIESGAKNQSEALVLAEKYVHMDAADTLGKIKGSATKALDKLRTLADFTEGVVSPIVYYYWKSLLERANFGTEQEIKQEAARRTKRVVPSHSMRPQAVETFSSNGISALMAPFIGFKSEMIRSTVEIYRLIHEDAKSGNDVLRRSSHARAAAAGVVHGGLTVIAPLVLSYAAGIGDDEDEAIRAALPSYAQNSSFLPLIDRKNQTLTLVDLTFLNPYSYPIDPITSSLRNLGNAKPEDIPNTWYRFLVEETFGEQVALSKILDVKRNVNEATGLPIYLDSDTDTEKVRKSLMHVVGGAYTPATVKKLADIGSAVVEGDTGRDNWWYTPEGIAFSMVAPFRPRNYRLQDMRYRAFNAQRKANAQLSMITSPLKSPAPLLMTSAGEIYNDRVEATRRVWEKIDRINSGFEGLGSSKLDRLRSMVDVGFSRSRSELLIRHHVTDLPTVSAEEKEDIRKISPERLRELEDAYRKQARYLQLRD